MQLSMLDLLAPAPPLAPVARPALPERRVVRTRAWSHGGEITVYHQDYPDPFEVEVRGVPCVIAYSGGVCTHAINPPGSPFWSDTGFRSFGWQLINPAEIVAAIEGYIDAPAKHGNGCDGKLAPWWPLRVSSWASIERFRQKTLDRATMPGMTPAEDRAAYWERADTKHEADLTALLAEGLDPFAAYPDLRRGRAKHGIAA